MLRTRYLPTLTHNTGDQWTIQQVTTHDPGPEDGTWAGARESSSTATGTLPWLHELVTRTADTAETEGDETGAAVWRTLLDQIDTHLAAG